MATSCHDVAKPRLLEDDDACTLRRPRFTVGYALQLKLAVLLPLGSRDHAAGSTTQRLESSSSR